MTLLTCKFQRWNESLSVAMNSINTSGFSQALYDVVRNIMVVDSIVVSLERKDKAPVLLWEFGVPEDEYELTVKQYFSKKYMIHPVWLAMNNGLAEGFYAMQEVVPSDFFENEFNLGHCENRGMKNDCYFVFDLALDRKISICVHHSLPYNSDLESGFTSARSAHSVIKELVLLAWGGGEACEQKNNDLLKRQLGFAFSEFKSSILSNRERDVSVLLMRGNSAKSAARVLGIASGTVEVHRKNIYKKLDISSQSELFSLFLDGLTCNTG